MSIYMIAGISQSYFDLHLIKEKENAKEKV